MANVSQGYEEGQIKRAAGRQTGEATDEGVRAGATMKQKEGGICCEVHKKNGAASASQTPEDRRENPQIIKTQSTYLYLQQTIYLTFIPKSSKYVNSSQGTHLRLKQFTNPVLSTDTQMPLHGPIAALTGLASSGAVAQRSQHGVCCLIGL